MSLTSRKRRIGIAAATTVSVIAVFGVAGGVGFAGGVMSLHQYGAGAGQYQYGKQKVTICHKGKRTIRISVRAWPKHEQRHGDTMGACAAVAKHGKKHGKKHGEHGKKGEHAGKNGSAAVARESKSDDKSEDHGKSEGHGKGHKK